MTDFDSKTSILSEVWISYREESGFKDFVTYNDLGLPLAFAITESIVETTPTATQLIEETFSLLLTTLGIAEDGEYETLDDLLADAAYE